VRTLAAHTFVMAGNSKTTRRRALSQGDRALADEIQAVLAMTSGENPAEVSQRARAALDLIKATQAKRELDALDCVDDEPSDAAEEQRLRDDLLRRLDALAAEIAARGGAPKPVRR
jgi:hypothetical protein